MNNDQVSGVYYTTQDYSKFKKLLGNRDVTEQRIAAIVDSMKRRGYITSPILVNEHFEIIDGQGRFYAEQRLGFPVEYIVTPGLTIEDCISMNIKMKNWNILDYVKSYADRGNPNYVRLLSLIEEFPSINVSAMGGMARKNLSAGNANDAIQKGNFVLAEEDMPDLRQTLRFIKSVQAESSDITGSKREFAIGFCFRAVKCNKERLRKVIREHHKEIAVPGKTEFTIKAIEDAYNYGLKEANRIYFTRDYKKACRESNASYSSRWEKGETTTARSKRTVPPLFATRP